MLAEQLTALFSSLGYGVYLLLFLALFVQTANPVGAAIPGSPLVFLSGLLVQATFAQPLLPLVMVLALGAWLGALVGYASGGQLDRLPRLRAKFEAARPRVEQFFREQGPKAVFIAYFVPFVRCVAPLAAGAGRMALGPFAVASALGALVWTGVFATAGYSLGQVPGVRQNLDLAAIGLAAIVVVPMILKARRNGPSAIR